MDDGSTFMIVALIVLIGLSAFFSAAETAYNSLNEIRLKSKADDGDEKAAHTLALVERYDSLLSTILIGNNIVNIGASSLATVLFTRLVGGVYGPTVSTIVMTLLVLTFGEHGKRNARNPGHGLCPGAQCVGHDFYADERPVRCVEKVPRQAV